MTARFFPDPRVRPVAVGMAWAVLTLFLIFVIEWLNGDVMPLRKLAIMVPIFAVCGLAWGYWMRWCLSSLAPPSPEGR